MGCRLRRQAALEADFGRRIDCRGISCAAANDVVDRPDNPNRFRRTNSVQTRTDWLFGRAVFVLQIPHDACQLGHRGSSGLFEPVDEFRCTDDQNGFKWGSAHYSVWPVVAVVGIG